MNDDNNKLGLWLSKSRCGSQRIIACTPALILIAIVWIICFLAVKKFYFEQQNIPLASQETTALACVVFLAAWWVVYFTSTLTGLPTLRNYLKHQSKLRGANARELTKDTIDLETKSRSTTSTIALFTAVMSLFLAFMLRTDNDFLTPFQIELKAAIVLLAFSTILLFIFSIDLLDTIANQFVDGDASKDGGAKTNIEKKLVFYQGLGNLWPTGGISHAYLGYSFFTVILTMSVAFFYPGKVGYFTAFFVYLGYPILFGFKMKDVNDVSERLIAKRVYIRNPKAKWVANIGVLLVIVLTWMKVG